MKSLNHMWHCIEQSSDSGINEIEILSSVYYNPPKCDTVGGLPEGLLESITLGEIESIIEEIRCMPTFESGYNHDVLFNTLSITRATFFEAANIADINTIMWDFSKSPKKNTFL